jgi:hypothetical protein
MGLWSQCHEVYDGIHREIAVAGILPVFLCAAPGSSEGSDRVRVGLKIGWPESWVSYDGPWGPQTTDTDTRIFSGGIVVELPLGDSATPAIVSGITYVVKSGAPYDGAVKHHSPDGMHTLDWETYYFAVPLMLKHSPMSGELNPYVTLGGEIGIPVKAVLISNVYIGNTAEEPGGATDITDDMRVVEFSLAAAVGFGFPIGSSSGFVEVTYSHGLNDVWREHPEEVRYRMVMVSGGILF